MIVKRPSNRMAPFIGAIAERAACNADVQAISGSRAGCTTRHARWEWADGRYTSLPSSGAPSRGGPLAGRSTMRGPHLRAPKAGPECSEDRKQLETTWAARRVRLTCLWPPSALRIQTARARGARTLFLIVRHVQQHPHGRVRPFSAVRGSSSASVHLSRDMSKGSSFRTLVLSKRQMLGTMLAGAL